MAKKIEMPGNFVTTSFASLLGELEARGGNYFTLTRDDGGALGLLTTDRDLIERIERTLQQFDDDRAAAREEEASHAGN